MLALWYLTFAIEEYRKKQSAGSKPHESKLNATNIVKPVVPAPAKNVTPAPASNNIQTDKKPVEIPKNTTTTTPLAPVKLPDLPTTPTTTATNKASPPTPILAPTPTPTPTPNAAPNAAPVLPKAVEQTRDALDVKLSEIGQKLNETKKDLENNVSVFKDPMDQKLAELSSKMNEKREQAKSVFEKSSAQLAELYSDQESVSDESQSDA